MIRTEMKPRTSPERWPDEHHPRIAAGDLTMPHDIGVFPNACSAIGHGVHANLRRK